MDQIPDYYGSPLIMENAGPVGLCYSWSNINWTPKHLVWRKNGKNLTLKEYLGNGYLRTQQYEDAGIQIIDLSSEEIKESVEEGLSRIRGQWIDTDEVIRRQRNLWDKFQKWSDFSKYHGWLNPDARVSSHFLKKMGASFYE